MMRGVRRMYAWCLENGCCQKRRYEAMSKRQKWIVIAALGDKPKHGANFLLCFPRRKHLCEM